MVEYFQVKEGRPVKVDVENEKPAVRLFSAELIRH